MNLSIGLFGLNAATRRIDEAAVEISRSASATATRPAQAVSAEAIAVGAVPAEQASAQVPTADLPTAMVKQIEASTAFMANVQSIRRADQNMEALLKLR